MWHRLVDVITSRRLDPKVAREVTNRSARKYHIIDEYGVELIHTWGVDGFVGECQYLHDLTVTLINGLDIPSGPMLVLVYP